MLADHGQNKLMQETVQMELAQKWSIVQEQSLVHRRFSVQEPEPVGSSVQERSSAMEPSEAGFPLGQT